MSDTFKPMTDAKLGEIITRADQDNAPYMLVMELANALKDSYAELSRLSALNEWVRVTPENIAEYKKAYYVWTSDNRRRIARRVGDDAWQTLDMDDGRVSIREIIRNVTHYRELPAPPEFTEPREDGSQ